MGLGIFGNYLFAFGLGKAIDNLLLAMLCVIFLSLCNLCAEKEGGDEG